MTRPLAISARLARRFLVRRQMLAPPRALAASPESVLDVARRLGTLQFDPLETPGARNHDLVLHARVRGYERAWCDRWLYGPAGERRLVEVYNKSLNLVPVEELAWHRLAWDRAEERHARGLFATRDATVRAVLDRLGREGATATAAVTRDHGGALPWYWAPTTEGRAVLEALFETGRVGIARRDGNRRHFDLMERLLPADLLARKAPRAEAVRHRVLSRHRSVGLLGAGGNAELWTGIGAAAERRDALASLVRDGELVPVAVEGLRDERYVLRDELPLLADTRPEEDALDVTLVAPLDPIVWDRKLLRSLWGFDYTWEVYTPEAKRRYGYYVLPVLFGDRFVGRAEPRFERRTATLTLAGLWFEEGFDPVRAPKFPEAFAEALRALATFVGAARVRLPRAPARFVKALRERLPSA